MLVHRTMLWPWSVLLIVVSIGTIADSTPVRHSGTPNMGRCGVSQIEHLPRHPSVIAFGSSRVREGIDPQALDMNLVGMGEPSVNMGRTGLSPMRSYVMLRDVLARDVRPHAVVYEIDLQSLAGGVTGKPITAPQFAAYMTWKDVVHVADPFLELNALDRLRLISLTAMAKFGGAVMALLGSGPLYTWDAAAMQVHCRSPAYDLIVTTAAYPRGGLTTLATPTKITVPPLVSQAGLLSPNALQELYYVGLARALCRSHGILFVAIRPKMRGELPISKASMDELLNVVPEFREPSAGEASKMWLGFADDTHMGAPARALYSRWVASIVKGAQT